MKDGVRRRVVIRRKDEHETNKDVDDAVMGQKDNEMAVDKKKRNGNQRRKPTFVRKVVKKVPTSKQHQDDPHDVSSTQASTLTETRLNHPFQMNDQSTFRLQLSQQTEQQLQQQKDDDKSDRMRGFPVELIAKDGKPVRINYTLNENETDLYMNGKDDSLMPGMDYDYGSEQAAQESPSLESFEDVW